MIIRYRWENVQVNYPKGHIYRSQVTNVNWEYQVNIKVSDIVDYLMPYSLVTAKEPTKEQISEKAYANIYMTKAIKYLVNEISLDLEDLENDQDFVEFMHDRYEEDAFQDFQDNNESDY